ncbi:MAG: hypothetical protein AAB225_05515 [Acidobacteriota bacterium]
MSVRNVVALLVLAAAAQAQDPGPEAVPEWIQQGRFRFTRLDGGPIEIMKTARSAWGKHFNDAEKEVLGNLYTKYAERMTDLLAEARINFVWLTFSVGYSWEEEAEQREQCKRLVARLRERGIRSAAYVCSVSMFWESMFRDEPRSVRWITFDPKGLPYRYSGGRDPLRFIADVSNPEWVELQKRRVGAAIDAGFDALFFDNTAAAAWAPDAAMDEFIGKIRRYIHEEKRSNLLLFTNYGLTPTRAMLNRNMEFVFAEGWREPGVWGEEWNVSNIRRTKYLRGIIPPWKPLTTEYSIFQSGNRATTWLGPRSQKLATAEAAAFHSDYSWDMEGPFDNALMTGNTAALESWKAIGAYGRFLREHEDLYWKAHPVSPVAVLTSGGGVSFAWDREDSGLYDLLAKNSVLFDTRLLAALEEDQLKAYRGVVLVPSAEVTPAQREMLERYRARGGKVYTPAQDTPAAEILREVRALAPDGPSLAIEGAPHVLGNVTRQGKRLMVHLLNYASAPASGLRVKLGPSSAGAKATLFTPDSQTGGLATRAVPGGVEFTLKTLDIYAVVVVE